MAANKARGEIPLQVGDKTYILKLTSNAMCELEGMFDLTMDQVMTGLQKGRLTECRALLWAMLQEHHPEITDLKMVGTMIDDAGGIVVVSDKLQAMWKLNTSEAPPLPVNGNGRRGNPRKAQRGTGVSSTSTPVVPG